MVFRSSAYVLAAAVSVVLFAGCRESRRVPRIEPVLRNWSEPYEGVEGLRVHVFNTGVLAIPKAYVFRGGSWVSTMELPATAFVIEHPEQGLIVFDTGFSPKIYEDPNDYIGFIVSILGSFAMANGQDLVSQMEAAGLRVEDVGHVVLSHLHFDHTGTLESFPNAQVVVTYDELQAARHEGAGISLIRNEDIDGVRQWTEVDFNDYDPYATFRAAADLLGDSSITLVDLSGHTTGSMGVLIATEQGPVLLTGDAATVEQSWRFAAVPLYAEDMDLWWEQVWRIKKFAQLVPSALVIPGHDTRILGRVEAPSVEFHEFISGRNPSCLAAGNRASFLTARNQHKTHLQTRSEMLFRSSKIRRKSDPVILLSPIYWPARRMNIVDKTGQRRRGRALSASASDSKTRQTLPFLKQ